MPTFTQKRGLPRRLPRWFRALVERVARGFMGEPATIIPTRQVDRLNQLERREQLRLAEKQGNDDYLDRELARVQLTPDAEERAARGGTPISQWPDEDFTDHFSESNKAD